MTASEDLVRRRERVVCRGVGQLSGLTAASAHGATLVDLDGREFIDFDESEGVLRLRFLGACGDCPISDVTLRQGIERRILTAVPTVREVRAF